MNTTQFPDDERYMEWLNAHGSTGVKNYELNAHPSNRGHVAVYREMSMGERQILARLDSMEEDHPGAFDLQRMLVSSCLLYPSVEDYPKPPYAVAELYSRVRQHGHGPLEDGEEMITENKDMGAVPEHVVEDIKSARDVAYDTFHAPEYGSAYKELVIELASDHEGQIDPQTLDYLWSLSPGRLRDIAARVEQVHADVRRQALRFLHRSNELDGEQKQARAEEIESNFASPWETIDQIVGDKATPDDEDDDGGGGDGEDRKTTSEPVGKARSQDQEGGLPPNRPPAEEEIRDIENEVRGIVEGGSS